MTTENEEAPYVYRTTYQAKVEQKRQQAELNRQEAALVPEFLNEIAHELVIKQNFESMSGTNLSLYIKETYDKDISDQVIRKFLREYPQNKKAQIFRQYSKTGNDTFQNNMLSIHIMAMSKAVEMLEKIKPSEHQKLTSIYNVICKAKDQIKEIHNDISQIASNNAAQQQDEDDELQQKLDELLSAKIK